MDASHMRSRLELTPYQRGACTLVAIALLTWTLEKVACASSQHWPAVTSSCMPLGVVASRENQLERPLPVHRNFGVTRRFDHYVRPHSSSQRQVKSRKADDEW